MMCVNHLRFVFLWHYELLLSIRVFCRRVVFFVIFLQCVFQFFQEVFSLFSVFSFSQFFSRVNRVNREDPTI
jgi:hypothetical protein